MRQQARIIRLQPGSNRGLIRKKVLKRALARRAEKITGPSASRVRLCGACGGVWEVPPGHPQLVACNSWAFCPSCVGGGDLAAGIRKVEKRIASREYQFCKICLGRTPVEEASMNWPGWVCNDCWASAQQLGAGNAVEAMCLAAPDVHQAQGSQAGSNARILPLRSKDECSRLRRRVVEALRAAAAGPGLTWKSPRTRVCQICGRVWEIRGLGNLLSARAGRGEGFCLRCVSRADAERALQKNDHRFCVVCLDRIPASSVNCLGVTWVCGDCRVEADRLGAPDALEALCQVAADVHEEVPFGARGGAPRIHMGRQRMEEE